MGLFSSKKTVSAISTVQSDERTAASDFATVIRAEEGSTVTVGATADQLQGLLGFKPEGEFAAERAALAANIAEGGGGSSGALNPVVIAALAVVGVVLLARR